MYGNQAANQNQIASDVSEFQRIGSKLVDIKNNAELNLKTSINISAKLFGSEPIPMNEQSKPNQSGIIGEMNAALDEILRMQALTDNNLSRINSAL